MASQNLADPKRLQAKIMTGINCNNRCLFCFDRLNTHLPEKTTGQLRAELALARKRRFTDVHFLGGEPTIRRDFFSLASFAKSVGFERISVTTNGRMLQYIDFARYCVKAGVTQFILSIHGHDATTHDALTSSPGSFAQLVQGLENLRSCGVHNVRSNTVITRQNYVFMPAIAKFLISQEMKNADLIYVAVSLEAFLAHTPAISAAAAYLLKALSLARQKGYYWMLLNAPMPCYFTRHFDHIAVAGDEKICLFSKNRKAMLYAKTQSQKKLSWVKVAACGRCRYNDSCHGVSRIYLKYFGEKEVKPSIK